MAIEVTTIGSLPEAYSASTTDLIVISQSSSAKKCTVSNFLSSVIKEPSSEGTSGQVLTTDGNGGRSWTTVQGGGYVLPIATANALGGIKVGTNLSINSGTGVLSVPVDQIPTQNSTNFVTSGTIYTVLYSVEQQLENL